VGNYASLSEVKEFLDVAGTTVYDSLLNRIISRAEKAIDLFIGRSLVLETYNESYDIKDDYQDQIFVRHTPIVSVVAVTDDGTAVDLDDLGIDEETGLVRLTGDDSYFTKGKDSLEICYSAGYATIPPEIVLATELLVSYYFAQRRRVGVRSERVGDVSQTFFGGFPPEVEEILVRYRMPL